eukprot:Sspe_Gene.84418::Locus_55423_Transcript_2_2_Confidence_0.286_Length_652::g.84418::m.84418
MTRCAVLLGLVAFAAPATWGILPAPPSHTSGRRTAHGLSCQPSSAGCASAPCGCSSAQCSCGAGYACSTDGYCYQCMQWDCRTFPVGCACPMGQVCDGNGRCSVGRPDDTACAGYDCSGYGGAAFSNGRCRCNCYEGFTGPSCDRCEEGYTGWPYCSRPSSPCPDDYCAFHGAVVATPMSPSGCACNCYAGFTGSR